MPTDQPTDEMALRVLTREELNERIQHLAGLIAAGGDHLVAAGTAESLEPRWIAPAELVRLVQPFLIYN